MDKIHAFYCRKPWRDLSHMLKIQRGGKCESCGFVAVTEDDWALLIGHHKTELTEENVDDPAIALNPSKIEIICLDCHNREHARFGHAKRVCIVWGSPLSGKTSAVRELMRRGDIVVDIDALWQAVTMQPPYSKPDNCRFNLFALRDSLLDQIKTRYGQWYTAWVIGGYPDKSERERLVQSLGAELLYCESSRQECLDRRRAAGRPEKWDDYIREWWQVYERTGL